MDKMYRQSRYVTWSSSRLNSQYSLRVPLPLVKIPQPLIMMVPDNADEQEYPTSKKILTISALHSPVVM